jgi:Tfp pilus assembly protein PilV
LVAILLFIIIVTFLTRLTGVTFQLQRNAIVRLQALNRALHEIDSGCAQNAAHAENKRFYQKNNCYQVTRHPILLPIKNVSSSSKTRCYRITVAWRDKWHGQQKLHLLGVG